MRRTCTNVEHGSAKDKVAKKLFVSTFCSRGGRKIYFFNLRLPKKVKKIKAAKFYLFFSLNNITTYGEANKEELIRKASLWLFFFPALFEAKTRTDFVQRPAALTLTLKKDHAKLEEFFS